MSKIIDANYEEVFLFPRAVEDWVEADHPARFIREVVEALDGPDLGLAEDYGQPVGRGRPQYAPRLLLKAWLYGYMNRIRSSRQLEKACREHISLIWLLGRHAPDHNTLWRFWRAHRKAIRKVFVQVVRIASKTGAVGLVLHAVDGTKIQAQGASRGQSVWSKDRLERDLAEIEQAIDRIESEIAACQSSEQGDGYRLPEGLAEQKKLRERVKEALLELQEADARYLNPHDPEARVMPCGESKLLAYNAQAVVDEQSGLIVAEEVSNQPVDCFALGPMLDQTEENLGCLAEDTVADKGYRTDQNIGEAAGKGRSVLVHLYKSEGEEAAPYHKSRFKYDAEQDCCICPKGKKLLYEGVNRSRHGWKDRRYRCRQAHSCPVAGQCSSDPRGRTVRIGPHEAAVRAQRERQAQEANKRKLSRRKVIVEPTFGHLKQNHCFRRWTVRGLENVQAQWSMLCTAYNLSKLLRIWRCGQLTLQPCPRN